MIVSSRCTEHRPRFGGGQRAGQSKCKVLLEAGVRPAIEKNRAKVEDGVRAWHSQRAVRGMHDYLYDGLGEEDGASGES